MFNSKDLPHGMVGLLVEMGDIASATRLAELGLKITMLHIPPTEEEQKFMVDTIIRLNATPKGAGLIEGLTKAVTEQFGADNVFSDLLKQRLS